MWLPEKGSDLFSCDNLINLCISTLYVTEGLPGCRVVSAAVQAVTTFDH